MEENALLEYMNVLLFLLLWCARLGSECVAASRKFGLGLRERADGTRRDFNRSEAQARYMRNNVIWGFHALCLGSLKVVIVSLLNCSWTRSSSKCN